jgi:hypothetical protein
VGQREILAFPGSQTRWLWSPCRGAASGETVYEDIWILSGTGGGMAGGYPLPTRLRLPRLPPSGRCASTSRNCGSSRSLSRWCTRTCLSGQELAPGCRRNAEKCPGRLTFASYPASGTCVRDQGKKGTHSLEMRARGRVGSSHSCA